MRKPIVFPSGRTIPQLAKELGVSRCYIWKLVQGGYDEQGIIDWFNRIVPYRKAQERGLRPSLVYQRMARGMTLDEALNQPVMTPKEKSKKIVKFWHNGVPVIDLLSPSAYDCFRRAVRRRGWSEEEAFNYYKDKKQ